MPLEISGKIKVSDFIEELQSEGRYTFTFEDLSREPGNSNIALRSALRRLKKKGRIVSPRRSFFVIVPPEYRTTGAPPASWFIDDLMSYLNQPYYVGLLSAATLHGASHQHPQIFQVVTNYPTTPMSAGRSRIQYYRKRKIELSAVMRIKTETGYMTVSTPETTVFDLIRHIHASGGLNNIATILIELAEVIDPSKLVTAATTASWSEVQRTGYLLQLVGNEHLAESLAVLLDSRRKRPALLKPDSEFEGATFDERWYLHINEQIEPDL